MTATPSYTTSTLAGIVAQDGNTSAGFWVGDDTTLSPATSDDAIGVVFDIASAGLASELIVEPTALRLMVSTLGGTASGVVSSVYVVDAFIPADFDSTTNLPGARGEITDSQLVCQVTGDVSTGDLTWDHEVYFTYMLGQRWANGAWAADTTLHQNWRSYLGKRLRHSSWTGRIALVIKNSSTLNSVPWFRSVEDGQSNRRPELGVLTFKDHTGAVGWPFGEGRVRHDPKMGFPALTSEFVEDGYSKGLWVHHDSWDEEDPPDRFRPNPREGVIKDKVL